MTQVVAPQTRWWVYGDESRLVEAALERILAARRAQSGEFHIVLAGGHTPRALYECLARQVRDWRGWRFYHGDERCLPAGAAERNSTLAEEVWLKRVACDPGAVHNIPAEEGAEAGARLYAKTLAGVPDFDLVLLGLGEDGHTASLFPGNDWGEQADAADTLAVCNSPKPPRERVSLSAARLNRAARVIFLVSGAGKRAAVARWRAGERLPASVIHGRQGADVLLDAAAWPEAEVRP